MSSEQADPRELVLATRRQIERSSRADETTKVLNQADALMRRHRVFVANAPQAETPAVTQVDSDDDLPVLTDAVDHPDQVYAADKPHRMASDSASSLRNLAMASIVNQWLEEALPVAIQEVSEELTDRLVAKLSAKARLELTERLIKELDKPLS